MSILDRDYQWVTERIALGSAVTGPLHVRELVSDGITHVLDCRMEGKEASSLYVGTGIVYLRCGVPDDGKRKDDAWFFEGIGFVVDAFRWPRNKVLVHCRFGMSRSPSMVYAILRAQGVPGDEAEQKISKARAVARVTYRDDAERAGRRWVVRGGRGR